MVKTLQNVDLTIVSEQDEIDFAKLGGKLEKVDTNNFLFTVTAKRRYDPKPRFFDGNCLSVTLADDNHTVRCYMKTFQIRQSAAFLEELYKEIQIAAHKLVGYQTGNMEV